MQDDDDGRAGGGVPLFIWLSIGGAVVLTLGVIAFVTFSNVRSTASSFVVAVRAPSPAPATPVTDAPERLPAAAVRPAEARPRRVAAARKAPATPAPSPSAPPLASPAPRASATPHAPTTTSKADAAALAKAAPAGRRVAQAASASRSDVAPVPAAVSPGGVPAANPDASAPGSLASAPPPAASPAATAAPVREAAANEAPPPAATPAVVAAVQAPIYAPQRVVEARVKIAAQPDFPTDPSVTGLRGTSVVLVTIGPQGRVIKTAIDKSSGHYAFDQAALNAARNSVYAPPLIDGRAATASYRMVYEFGQ